MEYCSSQSSNHIYRYSKTAKYPNVDDHPDIKTHLEPIVQEHGMSGVPNGKSEHAKKFL
jgi:hypothetical protein